MYDNKWISFLHTKNKKDAESSKLNLFEKQTQMKPALLIY